MELYKKNLAILCGLAMIGDLGGVSINVLAVLYSTKLGMSTVQVGLIGAAYGLTYLIMPALLGHIGDKIQRKTSLLLSTALQICLTVFLLFILLGITENVFFPLFLLLLFYGIVYGFYWPTIEAYISENAFHSVAFHRKAIALFCIFWSLGYALGPYVAGIFLDYQIITAGIFVLVLYIIGFFGVLFGLSKAKGNNHIMQTEEKEEDINSIEIEPTSTKLIKYIIPILMVGSAAYAMISKIIMAYFPNYAFLSEGLDWSASRIGGIMLFFGFGRTAFFLVAHLFKNTFQAIIYSLFLMGTCLFLLIFLTNSIIISILFFILGLAVGRSYYVSLELLMKYEIERKGAKAGIFESLIGLGSATTPIIAGSLAIFSLIIPFFAFSLFTLILACLLFLYQKKKITD